METTATPVAQPTTQPDPAVCPKSSEGHLFEYFDGCSSCVNCGEVAR